MTDVVDSICWVCKHLSQFGVGCAAFPDGIPDKIRRTNKHDKVLKEQTNKLVFEFDPTKVV